MFNPLNFREDQPDTQQLYELSITLAVIHVLHITIIPSLLVTSPIPVGKPVFPKHLCPGRSARSAHGDLGDRSDPVGHCGHVQSDRPGRSARSGRSGRAFVADSPGSGHEGDLSTRVGGHHGIMVSSWPLGLGLILIW